MDAPRKHLFTLITVSLLTATIGQAKDTSKSEDLRSYHRNMFQHRVTKTSKLWPSNVPQYCIDYGYLIRDAESIVKSADDMPMLEELVQLLLEKSNPQNIALSRDYYYRLWKVQADALERLLGTANRVHASGDDRVRYAAMVILFMKRLNQDIIPDFKPRPVYANVAPPISSGPMMAGMSPSAIKDPVARAAYLKAIEENSQNNVLNSKQYFFRDTAKQLNIKLAYFLKETKSKYPDLQDQIEKLSSDKQP